LATKPGFFLREKSEKEIFFKNPLLLGMPNQKKHILLRPQKKYRKKKTKFSFLNQTAIFAGAFEKAV